MARRSLETIDNNNSRIEDIFKAEGVLIPWTATANNIDMSAAQGAGILLTNLVLNANSAYFFKSVGWNTNKATEINILSAFRDAMIGLGATPQFQLNFTSGISVDCSTVLKGSVFKQLNVYASRTYDSDKSNVNGKCVFSGVHKVYDDLNFNALNSVVGLGDSILDGTGSTNKLNNILWAVRRFLSEHDIDCRAINLSQGGSTSQYVNYRINQSVIDSNLIYSKNVRFFVCNHGVNDQSQNVSLSEYESNLRNMVSYRDKVHPDAIFLFLGATPVQSSTRHAALDAYRTRMQAVAESYSNKNVLYLNLSSAFDRNVESNFFASDPAGDKVHPSDAGHTACYNAVYNFLEVNKSKIL